MSPSTIVMFILLCLSIVIRETSSRYSCLCSYLVNREIYEKPDTSSNVDGFLYEFECKPVYNVTGLDKHFIAVGNEGRLGFVHTSPNAEIQTCQGSIPDKDRVKMTGAVTSMADLTKATPPALKAAVTTAAASSIASISPEPSAIPRLFATPTECPEQVRLFTAPQFIHIHGNKCYEFVPANGSWTHAKIYCNSRGGNLVSIENDEEQIFIRNFLARINFANPLWLGLHDSVNEENWKWDTGDPVTYTNWMPGRYIDQYHEQEDCGLFVPYRKGQWDDVSCNGIVFGGLMRYNWMCQYSLVLTHSTTKTATEHTQRFTPHPHTSQSQSIDTATLTSTTKPTSTHSTEMSTTVAKTFTTNSTQKVLQTAARLCAVCSGPGFLCEKLYESTECTQPNNYCINKITNNKDGSRLVNRTCGNLDVCHLDWYEGSSDSDKCRNYDETNILNLEFDCTFCCVQDNCNIPLRPKESTLYTEV